MKSLNLCYQFIELPAKQNHTVIFNLAIYKTKVNKCEQTDRDLHKPEQSLSYQKKEDISRNVPHSIRICSVAFNWFVSSIFGLHVNVMCKVA